jgi:hypothetical protein
MHGGEKRNRGGLQPAWARLKTGQRGRRFMQNRLLVEARGARMAYRWRLEGPAFEFPTPYDTENRFLKLRGYVLLALATVIVAVVALSGRDDSSQQVVVLEQLPEPASIWPHLLTAVFLSAWGAVDLLRRGGQRVLTLVPGQPASLATEVAREAVGSSPGTAWLTGLLRQGGSPSATVHGNAASAASGDARPVEAEGGATSRASSSGAPSRAAYKGPWAGWPGLRGMQLADAPHTLHFFLSQCLAHGLLALGLCLALGVAAVAAMSAAGLALAAVVLLLAAAGVIGRQMLAPFGPALRPLWIGLSIGVSALAAAGLARFAGALPQAEMLASLRLPAAAAVLLAGVALVNLLGVVAGRSQARPVHLVGVPAEEAVVSFDAEPTQLLREVDRELDRRWSEGIPNRRHAWQPPRLDPLADEGTVAFTVLEESQPLPPPVARGSKPIRQTRGPWPGWLAALSVAFAASAGLLWLAFAYARTHGASGTHWQAPLGLVFLLLGGYTLSLAHFLWSRVEVESTLIWLDVRGSFVRRADRAPPDTTDRPRAEAPVEVDELVLRSTVARLRSAFYAAGSWEIGSRALLSLAPDPSAARVWTTLAQEFSRKAALSPAAATPAVLAARARARERREAETAVVVPRRAPRFCSACGTPLLQGARFCQQCGQTLAGE